MQTVTAITGLRETVRNLERLGVDVKDLKDAFTDISEDVAEEARGLVRVKTGAHQASIRPGKTKNKAVVRAGTAARAPAAGVLNYHNPGDGFLTRPANANPAEKVARINENLEDLIRKNRLR